MGRSTRFFGARVLRSGRRVWTGPSTDNVSDGKKTYRSSDAVYVQPAPTKPAVRVDNKIEKLVDLKYNVNEDVGNDDGFGSKTRMDVDEGVSDQKGPQLSKAVVNQEIEEIVDKMYGIVYIRKRKRKKGKEKEAIQYFRRKKRIATHSKKNVFNEVSLSNGQRKRFRKLAIVVGSYGGRRGDGSGSSYWVFSSLLDSILRYLRMGDVGMRSLCAFVCSVPIVHVFAVHGVRFLQNFSTVGEPGSCIIAGVMGSIPLFSVDFVALPFVFLHLHTSLSLWYSRSVYFCWTDLSSSEKEEEELNSTTEFSPSIPLRRDQIGCEFVVALPALGLNKIGGESVNIESGCKILKRRTSGRKRGRPSISRMQRSDGVPSNILRPRHNIESGCKVLKRRNSGRKRGRPSISRMQRSDGVPSNIFRSRHNGIGSSQVSTRQLRSSNKKMAPSDVHERKRTLRQLPQKIRASSCSANILVIESDKCYRVEGAITTLELSELNQWCLTIRKGGFKQYSITAEKVMKPCSTNRITHDIIWSRDSDLKLEFPNRKNWLIFKELYNECFERNMKMPGQSVIPVPHVTEVEDYDEVVCLPFVRPHCYISLKDDELARALKKTTANYDMGSVDEEWLHKFNSDYAESEVVESLSAERFELMIDALEKACHRDPNVLTNAEAAYSVFADIERKIVEAVYGYWILKRKLKRAALVRVFQLYQPMNPHPISKFNSRKKRSFKRPGIQDGRGKRRKFFHAFVAEQDDAIEQKKIVEAEEAKARLERLQSLASEKRQRAQELFENADLAAYKALMAVRIAEAAQLTESTQVAASYILD